MILLIEKRLQEHLGTIRTSHKMKEGESLMVPIPGTVENEPSAIRIFLVLAQGV